MPAISSKKPYRIGRSQTGLGLFATKPIKKGSKIVRYFGPLLDCKKKRAEARAERLRLKAKAERKALKRAEKEAAKASKLKQHLNGANGVNSNGKLFNGHGSTADQMIAVKSGISARPPGKPGRESRASA